MDERKERSLVFKDGVIRDLLVKTSQALELVVDVSKDYTFFTWFEEKETVDYGVDFYKYIDRALESLTLAYETIDEFESLDFDKLEEKWAKDEAKFLGIDWEEMKEFLESNPL